MPISSVCPRCRGSVVVAVVLLSLLVASTTTSAPPVTTTPPAQPTEEDLILEAAENYSYAILAANTDPVDPAHPDLMRWVTGPALARAQENVRNRQAAGLAARLPEGAVFEATAEILERDEAGALVRTCTTDESVEYVIDTEEVTNAEKLRVESELRVVETSEGWWRVTANLPNQDSGVCE